MSNDSSDGVSARIDHTITSGTFSLDGQTFDVDNNVWVVGDDEECVIIDAPHDVGEILELVGERRVIAVLCTVAAAPGGITLPDRGGDWLAIEPDEPRAPVWPAP